MNKAIFCIKSYMKDSVTINNPFKKLLKKVIMFNYIVMIIFILNNKWMFALISAVASILLDFYKFVKYNGEWKQEWKHIVENRKV